jgi:hypothetical protein
MVFHMNDIESREPYDAIIEAVAENHLRWWAAADAMRAAIRDLEAELELARDAIAAYEVLLFEMPTQGPFKAATPISDKEHGDD